ncbi:MAG: hypothetical protein LBG52_06995 [Candidatus Peribacteria bacterium]|jgi:hypothetical protein|nr:hypothetical protein [Candidatus Peribacteria bacterium]
MAILNKIKNFFKEDKGLKAPIFFLTSGASGTKISNGRLMVEYNRLFQ